MVTANPRLERSSAAGNTTLSRFSASEAPSLGWQGRTQSGPRNARPCCQLSNFRHAPPAG